MNAINFSECFIEFLCESMPMNKMDRFMQSIQEIGQEWLGQYINTDMSRVDVKLTPYRLLIRFEKIPVHLVQKAKKIKGPKDGTDAEIVEKFAAKYNAAISDLSIEDGYYYATQTFEDQDISISIINLLDAIVSKAELPERMHWGKERSWIRPIRRIMCIFDSVPVIFHFNPLGLKASVESLFFLHDNETFAADCYKLYEALLKSKNIFLDPYERAKYAMKLLNAKLEAQESIKNIEQVAINIASAFEAPCLYRCQYVGELDISDDIKHYVMREEGYIPIFRDSAIVNDFLVYIDKEFEDEGAFFIKWASRSLYNVLQEINQYWVLTIKHSLKEYVTMLESVPSLFLQRARIKLWLERFCPERVDLQAASEFINIEAFMPICMEKPNLAYLAKASYALHMGCRAEIASIIENSVYPERDDDVPPAMNIDAAILSFIYRLDQVIHLINISGAPKGSSDPLGIRRQTFAVLKLGLHISTLPKLSTLINKVLSFYVEQGIELSENLQNIVLQFMQDKLISLLSKVSVGYAKYFVSDDINWREKDHLTAFLENDPDDTFNLLSLTKYRLLGILDVNFGEGGDQVYDKSVPQLNDFLNNTPIDSKSVIEVCNLVNKILNSSIAVRDLQKDKIAEVQQILQRAYTVINDYFSLDLI